MSTLREPSLGPIVGHTTHETCRLWIRGADTHDKPADLADGARTIGVVALVSEGGQPIPPAQRRAYYFRLHREFDRTGTFNLGADTSLRRTGRAAVKPVRLKPDTAYEARLGTLIVDDAYDNDEMVASELIDDRLPQPGVWIPALDRLEERHTLARFRTAPEPGADPGELRFLLGSCRYPGLAWKRKHSDRIFGPMYSEYVEPEDGLLPRFNLMVGDQIYADMLNRFIPIGLADTYAEFQDRYIDAFGSTNMSRLLRETPNYMILDDHEIEDNWTQDRLSARDKRVLFKLSIGAYASYQWSHCPRTFGKHFFYDFECAGYPFFVMDGRTQRYRSDDPLELEDNHMLGRPSFPGDEPSQLERLCKWLVEQQRTRGDVPKFLVSASVFVPNPIDTVKGPKQKARSDSWPAFPTTRRELLRKIVRGGVQNVVFLSGDIHCSNVAEMTFRGTPEAEALKAFSVTSSSFYWPFPFADGEPAHFVHSSVHPRTPDTFAVTDRVTMDYRARAFTQEDNYCQLTVEPDGAILRVRAKDKRGAPIKAGRKKLDTRLSLAPW